MKRIISCDWGTSSLRLRSVDLSNTSVLAETVSDQGVLKTFELSKASRKSEEERLSYYQSVLAGQIRLLEKQLSFSLNGDPIAISGMASSNIGMTELPYKQMPFAVDGSDLELKMIGPGDQFKHSIILISGAKSSNDMMRGEETQLIGCLHGAEKGERLFIFPGTHSKHVTVIDDQAIDVRTYMTGEFFELLSQKSILSNDIEESGDLIDDSRQQKFKKGVRDSVHSNLLHNSFLIRADSILGKTSKAENFYYLSGLLIGTELKELASYKNSLSIVGNTSQTELYWIALNELGLNRVRSYDANLAVIRGQCRVYNLCQRGWRHN